MQESDAPLAETSLSTPVMETPPVSALTGLSLAGRLQRLQDAEGEPEMTVQESLELMDDQGLYLALLLFALPNALPFFDVIPLFSVLLGLPVTLIGVQILRNKQTLWLPDYLRRKRFSREFLKKALSEAIPVIASLEAKLSHRLPEMVSPLGEKAIACGLIYLSFASFWSLGIDKDFAPLAMCLFAASLLARDGAVAVGGWGLIVLGVLANLMS